MDLVGKLTLEQQLELRVIEEQSKALSLEQAQEYVVEVMRQIMIRDNLVDHLLTTSEKFVQKQPKRLSSQAASAQSTSGTYATTRKI